MVSKLFLLLLVSFVFKVVFKVVCQHDVIELILNGGWMWFSSFLKKFWRKKFEFKVPAARYNSITLFWNTRETILTKLKKGTSSQWSFGPNSARGIKETTTIGKTHLTLKTKAEIITRRGSLDLDGNGSISRRIRYQVLKVPRDVLKSFSFHLIQLLVRYKLIFYSQCVIF